MLSRKRRVCFLFVPVYHCTLFSVWFHSLTTHAQIHTHSHSLTLSLTHSHTHTHTQEASFVEVSDDMDLAELQQQLGSLD